MKVGELGLVTVLALGPASAAAAVIDAESLASATVEPQARPKINVYGRDIQITAPLQFNRRILGEVGVLLTTDDRFLVDSADFIRIIGPLLTPEALGDLNLSLAGKETFEPSGVAGSGIWLEYDPTQLALMVVRIDPANRVVESLYERGRPEDRAASPEPFSAYLNTNVAANYLHYESKASAPNIFLNTAIRYGDLVFEADIQGGERFSDGEYRIDRRYARFVYDQPEAYRRWYLGDLTPETRGRQGFSDLGGVGVARQRRRYDSFRNNVIMGGRQLLLQEASTVRVLRNGVFQREFRLDPGQYDISGLPLDTGSNDVRLEIQGESGRLQEVNYRAYIDAIDLEPGDYEYAAYLGVSSQRSFGGRDYSDGDLLFSGYWRKAFVNKPAVGFGLQLSEDIQALSGQTQFILGAGGRLALDGAASNGPRGGGYAYALSYDFTFTDEEDRYSSWTIVADYTSADFAMAGGQFINPTSWVLSGSYSRRFTADWFGGLNLSYRKSRDEFTDDSYSLTASSTYRVNPEWSVRFGVDVTDYGDRFGGRNGVGGTFALIWQPRYDRRAEAEYASVRNNASLRYQQMSNGQAGSLGYSVASTYSDGPGSVSGQIDYVANRFDASLSHAAYGESFSSITDRQVTSLRFGSSIATAGGKVGVGRVIQDSFALVYPHPSLKGRQVIAGDNLQNGWHSAESGAAGAAVVNRLTAYVNQSVRYDVVDPPAGYNVGEGVLRVHPTYRSGYAIEVGGARFVSAVGRLVGLKEQPLALMSGRVREIGEDAASPELFFTNSVGRFAVQNLEPGKRYRVDLFSDPAASFEFEVPADSEGLLDLQVVRSLLEVPET